MRSKNGQPLRFSILSLNSSQNRQRYAVLLQDQFRKVGAQVQIDESDYGTYVERSIKGDFDTALLSLAPDPNAGAAKQSWATASVGSDQNILSYSNPKVDALLDSVTGVFDAAKMKAYASRAFQTIIDDQPAVFLYDQSLVDAINRRIVTPPLRKDGWWMNLADWTIPPDKRIARDKIGLRPAKP
jgi:peptide/nickel transport system substrate-binding protein